MPTLKEPCPRAPALATSGSCSYQAPWRPWVPAWVRAAIWQKREPTQWPGADASSAAQCQSAELELSPRRTECPSGAESATIGGESRQWFPTISPRPGADTPRAPADEAAAFGQVGGRRSPRCELLGPLEVGGTPVSEPSAGLRVSIRKKWIVSRDGPLLKQRSVRRLLEMERGYPPPSQAPALRQVEAHAPRHLNFLLFIIFHAFPHLNPWFTYLLRQIPEAI